MKKTDREKIDYIVNINSKDVISSYYRKIAKGYMQELYHDTIQDHNRFARMYEQGLITLDECINFQNNCITFIRALKQLNSKHKLLKQLID